ncbi:DUF1349 domain-containing protein [Streptomyces sp. 3MP-14]|uniref:DUF1349 domain-containing protein n=1 Tax=Streptomyces mimosae TaxID=2586635 RepID=A0A5N6ACC7_9ACTN|nr:MULTISPECIES: DUF1349 domain-containing protein [Streptomyces]KAB8165168.1 DUF1349 domain-containing protein [Streptomyces mimosae]KAB8175800.1 DUF1349 domain-containing protein [Streptomyces sp. 3MP-14]
MNEPAPRPGNEPVPYRSAYRDAAGGGFRRLLRAEWTKLRSVPRWGAALLAVVLLTLATALVSQAGSSEQVRGREQGAGAAPPQRYGALVEDAGAFDHGTLAGDGSITARVTAQADSHPWAKAGLMVREHTRHGADYAAVLLTPEHGVRFHTDYADATETAGGAGSTPRWLRLTREGGTVTGYASPDGADWRRVGSAELPGLPEEIAIGVFVASPGLVEVERSFGGEGISESATVGEATFAEVDVAPPAAGAPAGTVTLTGQGDIGPLRYGDDTVQRALSPALVGLTVVVGLAVVTLTSELRTGMVRTTFAASPRRTRVLLAKSLVLGGAVLVAGALAALGSVLLADPAPLTDGPVLRAVLGTAALLAVVAVLSLAVATLLRHGAVAVAVVLLLILVPEIVAPGLPLSAALWLERLTPAAGLAIQQTVTRYDTAISPWGGFAVLCGYAALAWALAAWRLRRRNA